MKKLICAIALFAAVCVPFAVFALADTQIDAVYLTGDTDISAGETPSAFSTPADSPYHADAQWSEYDSASDGYIAVDGAFESGHTYFLNLHVTADDGYVFSESGTDVYINGILQGTADYSGSGLNFALTFEVGNYIRELRVDGVTAPQAGQTSSTEGISVDSPYCTVSGAWSAYDEASGGFLPFSGTFALGGEYRLTLSFMAEGGYEIDPSALVLYVGEGSYFNFYEQDGAVCADIYYELSAEIGRVDIYGVTEPAAGSTASTEGITVQDTAPYSITSCGWIVYDSGYVSFEGVFSDGETYCLEILLTAAEGYSFADTVELYINGTYHSNVSTASDTLYIFEEYTLLETVTLVRLTGSLNAKAGAVVANYKASASSDKYTVSSEWIEYTAESGAVPVNYERFQSGGIYELHITVIAAEGVQFSEDTTVKKLLTALEHELVSSSVLRVVVPTVLAEDCGDAYFTGFEAPVVGAPVKALMLTSEYSNKYSAVSAYWKVYDADSGRYVLADGIFEDGHTYTLFLEIWCEYGYSFSDEACVYLGSESYNALVSDYTSMTVRADFTPEEREVAAGDADGDGVLSNADVSMLVRYLSGWDVEMWIYNADTDKNKAINNRDVIALVRVLALADNGEE